MRLSPLMFAAGGLASVAVVACPERGQEELALVLDAGPEDAGEPQPPELKVLLRAAQLDGGFDERALEPGQVHPIDPVPGLELSVNVPLRNYRVRFFDEADRALPSDDQVREVDQRLEYRVQFQQPLKPGHSYTLVLDPQTGGELRDANGFSYPEQRLQLRVLGERVKEPPPSRRRRRR